MRAWRGFAAVVLASLGLCAALAAGAAELREGRDFRVINPPLVSDRNTLEVTEFFWYGCPHCYDFDPVLATWVTKLPAGVSFRRVPALLASNRWLPGAKLYYTLEAMNLLGKLHGEVFKAIHVEHQRLDDEKILFEWLATKGVDTNKFGEAWSSPDIQSRLQQSRELTMAAGLTGVPSVMVNGRYLALTRGDYEELTGAIDQLIGRVRAESGRR